MPKELTVAKTQFAQKIRKCGAQCISFGMGAPKGWPDRCIISRYWNGWVELKLFNGKLSKDQRDCIDGIRWSGGNAFVAWYLGNGQWEYRDHSDLLICTTPVRADGLILLTLMHDYCVNGEKLWSTSESKLNV